jgi:hypothetical protein
MPREVTVSITYDMDDDLKDLKNELEDWPEAKITMKDVVHGKIAFHYKGTKGWTTWGNVISIKENTGLFKERKPLSVEGVLRLANGNWSGNRWW